MKKIIIAVSVILTVTVLMFAFSNNTKARDIRYISVKSAPLKEGPRNFSKTIATLNENEKVEVLEKVETWLLVISEDDMEGYIQSSVVSTSTVKSGSGDNYAMGDSATAGARGFSSEVEAKYKNKKDFDYKSVDVAEKLTKEYPKNPEIKFAEFRKSGKLGEYID